MIDGHDGDDNDDHDDDDANMGVRLVRFTMPPRSFWLHLIPFNVIKLTYEEGVLGR